MPALRCYFLSLVSALIVMPCLAWAQARHLVKFQILDAGRNPLPCRVHLKDSAGKPVRPLNLPFWRDHFVCPGEAALELDAGNFSYEIERGPEYRRVEGKFECTGPTNLLLRLERFADMASEGWWSGEMHVHRPVEQVELLMKAEDLHVAPIITWWNNRNPWIERKAPDRLMIPFDGNRFYQVMGGEDEREGGALLYFNLQRPLSITGANREFPSPLQFLAEARKEKGAWVDIEKPFWWDLPIWLASGEADSIGIANNHMCRTDPLVDEAWGKPRDFERLPSPRGNGFWSQEIYYNLLNCGLRIPPSAGSASGVLPNPVGYNRIYVHLEKELTYEQWWEGVRAGRSFVSNGPLLRCKANDQWPGAIFKASEGQRMEINLTASIDSQDSFSEIEIIRNGRVERKVPLAEWQRKKELGTLSFTNSGWFLVRVVADNPRTFRFASTAPYYVEIGSTKHRTSKSSAQFFLDWTRERRQRVKLENPQQRAEVLKHHDTAEKFWLDQVARANAE